MKSLFFLASPALAAVSLLLACASNQTGRRGEVLAEAPSRYAILDGYRVHYKSSGSGHEALVFIHGWTCDLTFWRFQAPVFAENRRVLLLDLPGHGASDKPQIVYSMDLFARAVEAVMRDARVERAVLVGHSMGTPVARQFYRLYRSQVLAVVAADGAFRPLVADPVAAEKFIAPYRAPDYRDSLGRMADFMFSAATPPETRGEMRRVMLATPQSVVVGAGAAMLDPSIWKEDPIEVPVLVALAKSPFWSADYEAFVRRLCPRLEYRIMEGTGHFLMVDKPQEFNEILSGFLARQSLLVRPGTKGRESG